MGTRTILVAFASFLSIVAQAQFKDLYPDFKRAQDMVKDFRTKQYSIPSSNNRNETIRLEPYKALSEPTATPYFENTPTEVKPLSATEIEVNKEISRMKSQISKLRGRKEIFKVALEKLQSGDNYQSDLEDWAKESQAAQIGAVLTCLSLLGDVAGPIKEAIDVHGFNSATIFNNIKDRNFELSRINEILQYYHIDEISDLKQATEMLTRAMQTAVGLRAFYSDLDNFQSYVAKSTKAIEYMENVSQKQDLLKAAKYTMDFAVKLIAEESASWGYKFFQKKLVTMGSVTTARYTALGKFSVNYLYNSMKFWVSWTQIDDILSNIDKRNGASLSLEIKIQENTDQIVALNKELKTLEAAKGNDDAGKRALYDIRQKQLAEAVLAADYYGQRTGLIAPGSPIEN
jgi:hypothetical protein